jgi:phage-related protein
MELWQEGDAKQVRWHSNEKGVESEEHIKLKMKHIVAQQFLDHFSIYVFFIFFTNLMCILHKFNSRFI